MLGYAIVLLSLLILLNAYISRKFAYWKKKNVPHHRPLPLFGTISSVVTGKKSITLYIEDIYNTSDSPYTGFFIFDKPALFVKDLDLMKRILINDFGHFEDRNMANNKEHDIISAFALLMLKGPEWVKGRTQFAATLSTSNVRAMFALLTSAADGFVEYVKKVAIFEEVTDCRELSIKYTVDALATYAFGVQANSFQNSDFYQHSSNLLSTTTINRSVQSFCYFFAHILVGPFRMTWLAYESANFLSEVFRKNVQMRMETKLKRGDLIDHLLTLEGSDGYSIDVNGLGISMEYMTAGTIGSATAISFCLYELCLHPEIQRKLRKEIRSVLAKHATLSDKAIGEMDYLDMCIKETLRKYPFLGFLDRRCTKTYQIPNTDIVIDEGVPVYFSVYGLQNDPSYFPEPERYDPERFAPENKSKFERFAFLPFGEGRRHCIGRNLGLLITKIALVKLLLNFEVLPSKSTPTKISLKPTGFVTEPKDEKVNVRFTSLTE